KLTIRLFQSAALLSVLLGTFSSAVTAALTAFSEAYSCTATTHSSESASALFRQGVEALQQNRFEQAVQSLSAALKLEPGLVLARYDLGVACFSLGRFEESRQAFEEVLRRSPGHSFARYFLGRIDLVQGKLNGAIREFESLSAKQPLADELYYLGAAYLR